MGFWSLWHFAIFIAMTLIAVWTSRRGKSASIGGYGGWLIALSVFLVFWAMQELAEFYRVRHEIAVLVPSALESPDYQEYIRYALGLAWLEAFLLIGAAAMLTINRHRRAVRQTIAALWIAGPVAAFTEFVMAESYFGDYLVEDDYSAMAATVMFATVWTCYLLTSVRVKNTYI